jgi:ATP-binding cassette subfamily A (ABC1) protein 3
MFVVSCRYGVGYNLTVVKASGCNSDALERIVKGHINDYRILSNVGSEMSFQVSLGSSHVFPALFAELETFLVKDTPAADTGVARILTYGISVTTLEEVFLRVAEEGPGHADVDAEAAKQEVAALAAEKEKRMSQRTGDAPAGKFHGGDDGYNRAASTTNSGVFWRHFMALLRKRWRYALRDRRAMFFQLLIPV